MEGWGSSFGSITTVARAAGAIAFDGIAPVGPEKDGAWWKGNRFTVHLKRVKMIKLFAFTRKPLWPCIQALEFAAGEVAECLFRGGDCL